MIGIKKRQTGWRFFVQRACLAGARLVTQGFYLVMVALHAMVLTLNQIANTNQVVLADFLHGFFVSLKGMVFTALGFVEHCFFVLASEHGFHVHPTAMHITGNAGGSFRIATQGPYGSLQLSRGGSAVCGALDEQILELWMLDVFSASLETFLTIFAGLDQVVQDGDGFFVDVGHFSIPLLGE
jgi:hypothetical protein